LEDKCRRKILMGEPQALLVNSRILAHEFEYIRAQTVPEAVALLSRYGERARPIAGGTDLLVQMKMERLAPEFLIDIRRIPELHGISQHEGLRIGATTSLREVQASPVIQETYTALAEAARQVGHVQVRTMGTIGGNISNASPAADSVPPLLVFDAKVKLTNPTGSRVLPLDTFFVGPGETVLSRGELLVEIQLPPLPRNTGSAFLKIGRTRVDLAKVSVAVALEREGEDIRACHIALGAVAEKPLRAREAEAILAGERYSEALIQEASQQVTKEIRPITDVRSTAGYRTGAAKTLVADGLRLAWQRAGGGE
jgi:CO/xanthine dehydrogenase FAD-binding subunit